MQTKNKNYRFFRSIRLSPAIGDWTTVQYRPLDFVDANISQISHTGFDALPKFQMKSLHYQHYQFAQKIVEKLSSDMDIKIELHSITAAQMSYDDFLSSLDQKLIQAELNIQSYGKVNMIFDWGLADMVVNRLTGGIGEESGVDHFSDIEQEILISQLESTTPFFREIWNPILNQKPIDLISKVGEYKRDKKIAHREAYLKFIFHLYFGKDILKKIIIAYPNTIIRRLFDLKHQIKTGINQNILLTPRTLNATKIKLSIQLGKTQLTMKEMNELNVGDVIPLQSSLLSPIDVVIGNHVKCKAQLGVVKKRMAIQIVEIQQQDIELKPIKAVFDSESLNNNQYTEKTKDNTMPSLEEIQFQETDVQIEDYIPESVNQNEDEELSLEEQGFEKPLDSDEIDVEQNFDSQ